MEADQGFLLTQSYLRGRTLRIEQLKLSGNVMHDSIYTIFTVLDSLKREKYVLGGVFNSYENTFQFRFLPKLLMVRGGGPRHPRRSIRRRR